MLNNVDNLPVDKPIISAPGRILGDHCYQRFRLAGNLYLDSIKEYPSPFTTLGRPLVIETRPDAFAFSGGAVRLKPASNLATLSGSFGDMAGHSIQRSRTQERRCCYG